MLTVIGYIIHVDAFINRMHASHGRLVKDKELLVGVYMRTVLYEWKKKRSCAIITRQRDFPLSLLTINGCS